VQLSERGFTLKSNGRGRSYFASEREKVKYSPKQVIFLIAHEAWQKGPAFR